MSGDAVSTAFGLLTDPRVGLPILLVAVALVLWAAAWPRRRPRSVGFEPATPEPDRDPVSRTYLALEREEYSSVLHETYDRLDEAIRRRTGRGLAEIPWTEAAGRRAGFPHPRRLRRTRDALGALELWAERLEADSPFRWDFWRSAGASRRRFRTRLLAVFATVDRELVNLEQHR